MAAVRGHLREPFPPLTVEVWRPQPLEEAIEAAIVCQLGSIPGRVVERQVVCCGHKPDIVLIWADVYTIVEVKREIIGWRAVAQLERYVDHWLEELRPVPERHIVYGILAAPAIRPSVVATLAQTGLAFQPVIVKRRSAA